MRIELGDRQVWLMRVTATIEEIKAERKKRDATYETAWAAKYDSRSSMKRFWFGPRTRVPPKGLGWGGEGNFFYPSEYACADLRILRRIRQALQTSETKAIFISGDELRAIL